jgi:hypothetical protein
LFLFNLEAHRDSAALAGTDHLPGAIPAGSKKAREQDNTCRRESQFFSADKTVLFIPLAKI